MRMITVVLIAGMAAAFVGCADDPVSSGTDGPVPAFRTRSNSIASTCELPPCRPGFGGVSGMITDPAGDAAALAGKIAFLVRSRDVRDHLYVMDPDGSNVVQLTDDHVPYFFRWIPDGRGIGFWMFIDGDMEIVEVGVDGSGLIQVTDNSIRDDFSLWSPDGTRLAYLSDGQLHVADADGANDVQLGTDLPWGPGQRWSPDGSQIILTPASGGLELMDVGTQSMTTLVESADPPLASPDWSPDGTAIAANCGAGICVVDASSGAVTALTEGLVAGDHAWSPDGSKLAMAARESGTFPPLNDIYVVDSDGSALVQVTDLDGASDSGPSWSPDGRMIVFTRGSSMIYVVAPDGTGLTLVSDPSQYPEDALGASYAVWSP